MNPLVRYRFRSHPAGVHAARRVPLSVTCSSVLHGESNGVQALPRTVYPAPHTKKHQQGSDELPCMRLCAALCSRAGAEVHRELNTTCACMHTCMPVVRVTLALL